MSAFSLILLFFGVSQIYWAFRLYELLSRRVASRAWRSAVVVFAGAASYALFEYSLSFGGSRHSPVRMTAGQALLAAPYLWWVASSMIGFLVAMLVAAVKLPLRLVRRPVSPSRRHFLENAVTAAPFVAGAYGLLYGRLNLETTAPAIRLPGLPKAFEGFRICQLSDIHIGPFMPAEEIRKYVAIANSLKPDLTVLTGDFVTFDGSTQQAAVEALSGLRAPFGV
jgi:hypothetical protein